MRDHGPVHVIMLEYVGERRDEYACLRKTLSSSPSKSIFIISFDFIVQNARQMIQSALCLVKFCRVEALKRIATDFIEENKKIVTGSLLTLSFVTLHKYQSQ